MVSNVIMLVILRWVVIIVTEHTTRADLDGCTTHVPAELRCVREGLTHRWTVADLSHRVYMPMLSPLWERSCAFSLED